MSDSRPIGVFDSGLGGLTVVKAIQKLLPNESIIYFGDTARVPYGNKSKELIIEYSNDITDYLIKNNSKLIVVACNTASAMALDTLMNNINEPVVGVINPGAKEAVIATQNKHVGIIGTVATISSGAYEKAIYSLDKNVVTSAQPCPLFVPLAEEGWLEGNVVEQITAHYLKPFNNNQIDTLILGCTHYPLLKNIIANYVNEKMTLIDSAEAVAQEIQTQLSNSHLLNTDDQAGSLTCYVTDIPLRFEAIGKRFLGSSLDNVQMVHEF
ncbi:MAG: glutamate racemase [Fidelibacterota bacterium]